MSNQTLTPSAPWESTPVRKPFLPRIQDHLNGNQDSLNRLARLVDTLEGVIENCPKAACGGTAGSTPEYCGPVTIDFITNETDVQANRLNDLCNRLEEA